MTIAVPQPAAHTRKPTALQGWVLSSHIWLATIAAVVISPVLPKIQQHFADVPRIGVLIALVATGPAIFVALLSILMGNLGDRYGHRKVLLWAVPLYGVFGTAPLWLNTLQAVVVSRLCVGIVEGAIITCGTALISQYWEGAQREKWLALATGSSTVVAVILMQVGGMLGEISWRGPFVIYAYGFVLAVMVYTALWDVPHTHSRAAGGENAPRELPPFRWLPFAGICMITVFSFMAFFIVQIQPSFLLTERGTVSPAKIGTGCMLFTLATPLGSILFGLMRSSPVTKLMTSFAILSAGFFMMYSAHGFADTVLGAAVSAVGCGMLLPTLMTWALSKLPPHLYGRGNGAWQSSMFVGQFISPLSVLWLKGLSGSLPRAVLIYGVACAAAAVITGISLLRGSSAPAGAKA